MSATEFLRALGSPAELQETAARSDNGTIHANTHVHLPANFSAFATVEDAVARAREAGLDVLGASNYYDYRVYNAFAAVGCAQGVFPLFGLEIVALDEALASAGIKVNDPGNPGKFYLCGKGITRFDPAPPPATALLRQIRERDTARIEAIIVLLNRLFAKTETRLSLDREAIVAAVAARSGTDEGSIFLQERHIAHAYEAALQAAGAPAYDVRTLMKTGRPAHVPDTPVRLDEALQLVRDLGGFPCYPLLADGAPMVSSYELNPAALAEKLLRLGIGAVEVIPPRNAAAVLDEYVGELRRQGLVVTAGTEHNTTQMGPLTPRPRFGEVSGATKAVFAEGAAVAVAHQFLSAHGEPGYVCEGREATDSGESHEAHIQSLAALGRAVLTRFRQRNGKEP